MDGVPSLIWWGPMVAGLLLGFGGRAWSARSWWSIALLVPPVVAAGLAIWLAAEGAPLDEAAPWLLIGWLSLLSLPPAAVGSGIAALAARLGG